jgi:hypothetical protein
MLGINEHRTLTLSPASQGIEGQLSNDLLTRVEQKQEFGPRTWKALATTVLKPSSAFKWHGT